MLTLGGGASYYAVNLSSTSVPMFGGAIGIGAYVGGFEFMARANADTLFFLESSVTGDVQLGYAF